MMGEGLTKGHRNQPESVPNCQNLKQFEQQNNNSIGL